MKKTGWIILGVIVVLVLWVFSGYNGMVGEQEKATTELAKIVKAYAKHEKETFEEVAKARASVGQVKLDVNNLTEASMKQYAAAQGELANAFSKLMLVAERYPELKASENFKALQVQEALKTGSARLAVSIMRQFSLIIRRLERCLMPSLPAFSISM